MLDDAIAREVDYAKALSTRLSDAVFTGLLEEAIGARLAAQRVESDVCELEPDGAVNGRGRCWIAGPGVRLREFHIGLGREIARVFSDDKYEVYSTRASYLYYDEGDFSFFHHDSVHALVTVIVGLTDQLLPLVTYPAFTGITAGDVIRLNAIDTLGEEDFSEKITQEFGARAMVLSVKIPSRHAVAIRGRRIPHARPRQPTAGMVCTACYSFLKPPQGWTIA